MSDLPDVPAQPFDFAGVRGFNYQGSWGTSGLDVWLRHDRDLLRTEVARGKRYFPGWNAVRWWLSHEAFIRNPDRFLADFEDGLAVFAEHGVAVQPMLFNRWRNVIDEYGGVMLEQIVPGLELSAGPDIFDEVGPGADPRCIQPVFYEFLSRVVGDHADDPRIFSWDLANEPLSGTYLFDEDSPIRAAELKWLDWTARVARSLGATQPLTIGNRFFHTAIELTEPIVDVISIHPYFIPGLTSTSSDARLREVTDVLGDRAKFEAMLGTVSALGAEKGKPVLINECVLGSLDDQVRVKLIEYTLEQATTRGLGYLVHALHHSLVADLHSAQWGPVGPGGRFEFINADGTLRAGHEVFNRFAR